MAMIVRSAPVYVGDLKIAELKEVTCSFKCNGELAVLSDEVIKSKGITTTEVSFQTVVPVTGLRLDLFAVTIAQAGVSIAIPFNGKTYNIDGTFDEATFKSVVQSGMSTGDFKFTGGTPIATIASF
jgi:hypothetical protein